MAQQGLYLLPKLCLKVENLPEIKRQKVIIVGGGTAGHVIAKKLSPIADVMMLERAKRKAYPIWYRIPLMIGFLFRSKNPYVTTLNMPAPAGRHVPFFQSEVLGGASVINGCVHVVGDKANWRNTLQKFDIGWSVIETASSRIFPKAIPLKTARQDELDEALAQSLGQKGYHQANSGSLLAGTFGPIINTVGRVFRTSVRSHYQSAHYKVILDEEVTNLLIDDNNQIVGVKCGTKQYLADKIILCAGVLGTNKLVNKPFIHVQTGSEVAHSIPAKRSIRDHTNVRINVKLSKNLESLNQIDHSFISRIWLMIRHLLGFKTFLRGTGATSSFHLGDDAQDRTDVRVNLLRFFETGRAGSKGQFFDDPNAGFSLSVTIVNPHSKGVIYSKGDDLIIHPAYLHDDRDMQKVKKTVQWLLALLKEAPMRDYVEEIIDLDDIETQPEAFILNNTYSGYHLIGGCDELIDSNFQLMGYSNIAICDASILSDYPASNIHAPVVLLAEVFGDRLVEELKYHGL